MKPKLVVFDWKRTLYNPDDQKLIIGARELLEFFKSKKIPMVLVGKGAEEMKGEVERLKVKKYFKDILFVEEEKDTKIYKKYLSSINPKDVIFIGDRVRSELAAGKELGATTIWIKQGKFSRQSPQNNYQKPDFKVKSLQECLDLVKTIFL